MVTSARSLLCLGSVAGALGRLSDLRGDRKLAAERDAEAGEREERAGALVWATHHRIRLAEALATPTPGAPCSREPQPTGPGGDSRARPSASPPPCNRPAPRPLAPSATSEFNRRMVHDRGRPPRRRADAQVLRPRLAAPGTTSLGQAVLALQASVGNAAVGRLLRQVARPAGKPAKPAGARVRRFSRTAIHAIQALVGIISANGTWTGSSDDSLERFKTAHRTSSERGTVDEATLDALVQAAPGKGMETEVVHVVAEFFHIDLSEVLSLRFDPNLTGSPARSSSFGGLDSIRIGPSAMTNAATVRAALDLIFSNRTSLPTSGPLPLVRMTEREAERAAEENSSTLRDDRGTRIVQALLDEEPTGRFTSRTSRRIAEFQINFVPTDASYPGRLALDSLKTMISMLVSKGKEEAAIRLVIDWYQLNDRGPMDVAVDANQWRDFKIESADMGGPALITFGSAAFVLGHESLVHTVEQAFVEARVRAAGLSDAQRHFLGFRARVMSNVWDDFSTGATTLGSLGFVRDARDALNAFNQLPPSVRLRFKAHFESLRATVENRFSTADPQDQANHAALLTDYRAVSP